MINLKSLSTSKSEVIKTVNSSRGRGFMQPLRLVRGLVRSLIYIPLDKFLTIYEEGKKKRLISSFKACGEGTYLGPQCIIHDSYNLELGNNVCINSFTHIFAGGGVKIGDNSMISANCSISSITHPNNSTDRLADPLIYRLVIIGKNVWIGMGAIILPGVTIGDDAIVGAGAVVTKSVAPRTVVVGNPARPLKRVELPGK